MDKRRIMVIAGEASGDLHASHLVRAIGARAPDTEFVGIGGARMKQAGVALIYDNRELAVTGFTEVLTKVSTIWQAYRQVKNRLQQLRPDLLILLDFPDFNLFVGKAAKKMGIPVVYYISPQVWAWRPGRIAVIREMVEKIMVILPFEASLYGDKGVFVGHPLLDEIGESPPPEEIRQRYGVKAASRVVTLLPGSRRNEVAQLLPVMLKAAALIEKRFPDTTFLLPIAPTIEAEQMAVGIAKSPVPVICVEEKAYDSIRIADFAVVASGTATLETAILGTPMVILYRVSPLTF
ncbi:MAG: lipid-A-disaccharide synthase, partial [bacterium]|nr:lipid-A-disaccharide synthase [bacterium]